MIRRNKPDKADKPVAASREIRLVPARIFTQAGWVVGKLHVAAEWRMINFINNVPDFFSLVDVVLEGRPKVLNLFTLQRSAILFIVVETAPEKEIDPGMRNQIEGGALQGMSRALGEEVTWDDRKITSVDWRSYQSLSLGFAPPAIEIVLLNQTDVEACGSGETSITVVAPAIGNAVFDATGVRLRQVPFTPERVRAALRNNSE